MSRIDAIADASRLALVRRLAAAPDSSAPELAAATGLHINTVRAHLAALEDYGNVERIVLHEGRPGRPTIRYRLREGFVPAGDELLALSSLLAAALVGTHPRAEKIAEVGREWGRRWSRHLPGEEPERRLRSALERLGFRVKIDGEQVRLGSCPCPLVSEKHPAMLCRLADAAVDGVLEGTGRRATTHRHDPKARVCKTSLTPA